MNHRCLNGTSLFPYNVDAKALLSWNFELEWNFAPMNIE
jgi:hypothetical protein